MQGMRRFVWVFWILGACGDTGDADMTPSLGAGGLVGSFAGQGGTSKADAGLGPLMGGAGGGTGGTAPLCGNAGERCDARACCEGATCIKDGTSSRCAANCENNAQCNSGCCASVSTGIGACGPPALCEQQNKCADVASSCAVSSCCTGGVCVSIGSEFLCAAGCSTGSECNSGCCARLQSGRMACAPASICAPVSGDQPGAVRASADDQWFAIETKWGVQVFEARLFCSDVLAGDSVTFASSTAACVSNSFSNSRNGKVCETWCGSDPDTGIITTAASGSFQIDVNRTSKTFTFTLGCRDFRPGNTVVFTKRSSSCFTQTLLNLSTGTGCDVRCP